MYIMIYKISQMAKKLNVSIKTLQSWDRKKIFVAKRTPTNRRFYTEEQLKEFLDGKKNI